MLAEAFGREKAEVKVSSVRRDTGQATFYIRQSGA